MPKRTKTSIYLDPPDLKRLKELAKKKDLTVAQMIRQAIRLISSAQLHFLSGGRLKCHVASIIPNDLNCVLGDPSSSVFLSSHPTSSAAAATGDRLLSILGFRFHSRWLACPD
jgi:hypothetical protein